jgi:glycosyltransferase involved in cell wall biosynthesis
VTQERIGVLQMCDTLDAGGMERVAVNLANGLPRERFDSHLCTTRRDGTLADAVAPHVGRLQLRRRHTLDLAALRRLVRYVRDHKIAILHAHGPSLFIAWAASLFPPHPRVVWHDHYGAFELRERPAWLYRIPAGRLSGVIAVSTDLAEWSRVRLGIAPKKIRFIANFVSDRQGSGSRPELPGVRESRIACVANLRPQKNHPGLLHAMALLLKEVPTSHLLLMGGCDDPSYLAMIRSTIEELKLTSHVTWLGSRKDVFDVLAGCDVGVLSSASEGLPLALLEYGMAGLPAVATRVGQCEEVLDNGNAGLLVAPGAPDALAEALCQLLRSAEKRSQFGKALHRRVQEHYSVTAALQRILAMYDSALAEWTQ